LFFNVNDILETHANSETKNITASKVHEVLNSSQTGVNQLGVRRTCLPLHNANYLNMPSKS